LVGSPELAEVVYIKHAVQRFLIEIRNLYLRNIIY